MTRPRALLITVVGLVAVTASVVQGQEPMPMANDMSMPTEMMTTDMPAACDGMTMDMACPAPMEDGMMSGPAMTDGMMSEPTKPDDMMSAPMMTDDRMSSPGM